MNTFARRIIVVVTIGVMVAAGVVVLGSWLEDWRTETNALWDQINMGDSEARVIATLGQPQYSYVPKTAPEEYYVLGYAMKKRAINGKVLIYLAKDMVFYIWFDEHDKVEDMFRGSS